jgi:hypothetical protein
LGHLNLDRNPEKLGFDSVNLPLASGSVTTWGRRSGWQRVLPISDTRERGARPRLLPRPAHMDTGEKRRKRARFVGPTAREGGNRPAWAGLQAAGQQVIFFLFFSHLNLFPKPFYNRF